MCATRRGNRLPFRQLLMTMLCLVMCGSFIPTSAVMAQGDSATPIAPGNVSENGSSNIGTQSVMFATFDQESYAAAPGDSIEMTLTITSAAIESTTGAVFLPGSADLTFTPVQAQRTENMTACEVNTDGATGIAASYALATGTGTCAISFSAVLSDTTTGALTVAAAVSENDIPVGNPTTTISVRTAGVSAAFSASTYRAERGETISVSLIAEMTGPIPTGTISIPVPVPEILLPNAITLANPVANVESDGSGTCTAELLSESISISFSEPTAGATTTCTVTFDLTVALNLPNTSATLSASGTAGTNTLDIAPATLVIIMATAPLVQFNPDTYYIPQGGSGRGSISVGINPNATPKDVTVSSPMATISAPEVVASGRGALCSLAELGDSVVITISMSPQATYTGSCVVTFTITLNPAAEVQLSSIEATSNFLPADLYVIPAVEGRTATFDQPSYSTVPGGTLTVVLTITIPAVPEITNSVAFLVSAPQISQARFTGASSSIDQGPPDSCAVNFDPNIPASIAGAFTPRTSGDVVCTFTLTMLTPEGGSGALLGQIPVISPPSALVTVFAPSPLAISLDRSTAAPGDEVTVTIVQTDPAHTVNSGSITGILPDGVTFKPDSALMSCDPLCESTSAAPDPGSSVTGSYVPSAIGPMTATMQFVVTINAAIGTSLDFSAVGHLTVPTSTSADPVTLTVQGDAPSTSDFNLVVEAGDSVSGSLANHLASLNGIDSYSNDAPSGDGAFTLDATTGEFTYTASDNPGTDSIQYTVTDTADQEVSGTIYVTIIEPLHLENIAHDMLPGETFTVDLNEAVSGGQAPHSFTPVTAQSLPQGTLTITSDGSLTYVANTDATGTEPFTFEVTDGLGLPQNSVTSAAVGSGTVTITFRDPLVFEQQPLILNLLPGATITYDLHDAISGGTPPFSFSLVTPPVQGTASIDEFGILTFTANDDATDSETLNYLVQFTHNTTIFTPAENTTGTIIVNYLQSQAPTSTATSPSDATATATSPDDPTATATIPSGSEPIATATSPSSNQPTATSPTDPNATATSPSNPDDPSGGDSNDGGSSPGNSNSGSFPANPTGSSGVTQLPATGTGGSPAQSAAIWALLLIGLALIGLSLRRRSMR